MKKVANKASILVLDDEKRQQDILSLILKNAGHDVTTTGSPAEALKMVKEVGFDLILTDLRMPGMDGIQFLERIKGSRPQQIILVLTGHGSIESAVTAMKKGAFHYLTKPIQKEELLLFVERALEQGRLIQDNSLLRSQLQQSYSIENMIGKDGKIQEVFRLIQRVAPSNTTVLIYGESGSGKELVAKAIHQYSPRSSLPMRAINCAAIPETLLESELLGYERGAFTGAYARKKGLLEDASGSSLFLDEIGDLSPALQGKILRVIEEQEIQRLGGNDTIQVDVRIISATHCDLGKMMAEGTFRPDLYYRLNTFPIVIPPLRDRVTDVPLFVDHFVQKFKHLGNGRVKRVSSVAMDRLLSYPWPGNVRQLESVIERAIILAEGEVIEEHHLSPEILNLFSGSNPYGGIDLPDTGLNLEELEKHLLKRALERSGGVIAKAARLLGLTYRTLQYRLEKYQLFSDHTKT